MFGAVLHMSEEQLYSLKQAAHKLGGLSHWTLRKHVARGTVKVVRLGRRVFLNEAELARIASQGLPSLQAKQQHEPTP